MNSAARRYLAIAADLTAEMRKSKSLSAERTEVLRLAREAGATYAEMAEHLGITEVAVYKALRGRDASAKVPA